MKKENNTGLICRSCGHSKRRISKEGICLVPMPNGGICGCRKSKKLRQERLSDFAIGGIFHFKR